MELGVDFGLYIVYNIVGEVELNNLELAEMVAEILNKQGGKLITVEDHQVLLGFGSFVAHQLALAGVNFKIKSLGVREEFGQSAYNAIDLYRKHRLDSDSIVQAAEWL